MPELKLISGNTKLTRQADYQRKKPASLSIRISRYYINIP
jgi:hypothetical protein